MGGGTKIEAAATGVASTVQGNAEVCGENNAEDNNMDTNQASEKNDPKKFFCHLWKGTHTTSSRQCPRHPANRKETGNQNPSSTKSKTETKTKVDP